MQTTLTDYVYMDLSFGSFVFCGERAMAVAIAAGDNDFIAVAIVGDSNQPAVPSGAFYQVLAEINGRSKSLRPQSNPRGRSLALSDLLPLSRRGIV
jgi:cytidine deaminase